MRAKGSWRERMLGPGFESGFESGLSDFFEEDAGGVEEEFGAVGGIGVA